MMRKQNTMYAKFAALLMTVILLTGCMCCTMVAASENLLADYDPSFEMGEDVSGVKRVNGATIMQDGGHNSKSYLSLTTRDDCIQIDVKDKLEPQTNYDFTFWMQNSVEGSLGMYGKKNQFRYNNKPIENIEPKPDWYVAGIVRIGDYFFGENRTGEGISVWRKVTLNFTSPYEYCNGIRITLYCEKDDPNLKVDDLSLVKTGKNYGRAYNGGFEALDESRDLAIPRGLSLWNTSNKDNLKALNWSDEISIQQDKETGNHYIQFKESAEGISRSVVLDEWPLYMKGYQAGKRYKFSFKYRSSNSKAKPVIQFAGETNMLGTTKNEFPNDTVGEWQTFTLYLNATKYKNDPTVQAIEEDNVENQAVRFGHSKYAFDLDDLTCTFDENSIDFYETFEFFNGYSNDGNRFTSGVNTDYFTNAFSSEKSVETTSLASLPVSDDGNRIVKTRAHIIPTEIVKDGVPTGEFNKEEITLFTAVYKYEGEKKTLVDINIATDSSTDGKVMDAVGTVSVPVDTDTATYKVEAVCWDMTNGIVPIMDKAVLE